MDVHLVDGTYELFRCFHGAPRARTAAGREVGAVRGLLATLVSLLNESGTTHVAVAFDSVVPPPRRAGAMSDEDLIAAQTGMAADVARALGLPVWPAGRYQADEIIATAASRLAQDGRVERVVICSSDNDFNQCVRGDRVVVLDRVRRVVTDVDAVRRRYGVEPEQIPDLHALVGDRSDGLPGVPGWGVTSASALLRRFGRVEAIPLDPGCWDVPIRGASRLAAALAERLAETILCRDLAVLRTDLPLSCTVDDVEWGGAHRDRIMTLCHTIEDDAVVERITRWSA